MSAKFGFCAIIRIDPQNVRYHGYNPDIRMPVDKNSYMKKASLFTNDQTVRFLVDDALFSDSLNFRISAINNLAANYRTDAIPIIQDVIESLPATDAEFRAFCRNVIEKINYQAFRAKEIA